MNDDHRRHGQQYSELELTAPWIGLVLTIGFLAATFALIALDYFIDQPQGVVVAIVFVIAAFVCGAIAVAVLVRGMPARSPGTSLDRKTPFVIIGAGLVYAVGGYIASGNSAQNLVAVWQLYILGSLLLAIYGCYVLYLNRRHYWRKPSA